MKWQHDLYVSKSISSRISAQKVSRMSNLLFSMMAREQAAKAKRVLPYTVIIMASCQEVFSSVFCHKNVSNFIIRLGDTGFSSSILS